jgi:hypothetical protein
VVNPVNNTEESLLKHLQTIFNPLQYTWNGNAWLPVSPYTIENVTQDSNIKCTIS